MAAAVWAIGAAYTLRLNPEVAFFSRADALKRDWAGRLDASHRSKFVVSGGSSSIASVVPRRLLEEHGLPVVNLGMGAAMGAKVLTGYAFKVVKPGDTLVVALEPSLLSGSLDLEPLGVQFCFATGQLDILKSTGRVNWPAALLDLRPGGYHVLTLLGKVVMRQPIYRYSASEFEAGGWQRVVARREVGVPAVSLFRLSAAGKSWLAHIRDESARRKVRVVYSMPWQFDAPENLVASRRRNLVFLSEVAQILPVLHEPSMGSHAVREHYADTELHLTAEGAALRTDELAHGLLEWSVWTLGELNEALESLKAD